MTGVSVADANAAYLVKKVVCAEYGITLEDMAKRSRSYEICVPRQVAMWLCHNLYNWKEAAVCKAFNKGRGTARNAFKTVDDMIDTVIEFEQRIQRMIKKIHALALKLSPIFNDERLAEGVMRVMEI